MVDVALVTDARRPFVAEVERELGPLRAPFAERGLSVALVDWDGAPAPPARLAVLRTTWNYHLRRDAFVRWCRQVPRLLNDAATVEWNSHKGYLRGLAAAGVPVIDTHWVPRGSTLALGPLLEARGWAAAVVKPAESGGAFRTMRFEPRTVAAAEALLATIVADCDAMVQPYLPAVDLEGERSLVFFDGAFSHAVRRVPPLATGQQGGFATAAADDELALAHQVLAAVPTSREPLLYARVDVLRDQHQQLKLMELELIEPSFFLDSAPGGAERFVAAVARRLEAAPSVGR